MVNRIVPLLILTAASALRLAADTSYAMYLDPSTQTVGNGGTVQLTLRLPPTPELIVDLFTPQEHAATFLQAFGLDVDFDPTVLQLISVDEGSFLSSDGDTTFFFGGLVDNTAGSATFISDARSGPDGILPSNGGDLLLLTFQTIQLAPSTTVNVQNACLQNSYEVNTGASTCEFSDIASGYTASASIAVVATPEPASALLLGLAGMGLICAARKRAQKSVTTKPSTKGAIEA